MAHTTEPGGDADGMTDGTPEAAPGAVTRRTMLQQAGVGLAVLGAGAAAVAHAQPPAVSPQGQPLQPAQPPRPRVPGQNPPEKLGSFTAPSDPQDPPSLPPLPRERRVGFAVVGLGRLALEEIIPAFGEAKLSRLVALVTGDRAKGLRVASEQGVPAASVYSYQNFDQIRTNPDVQVVYVVLPNSQHREYTERAARAGKHVLCEKPMTVSSRDAEAMIAACRAANRKLMIAYRIQYEPHNRAMQHLARSGQYGALKLIEGFNGQVQGDPSQWRQQLALAGGGSLPDVGLYCLNTARFITGEEPVEVCAWTHSTTGDPRFREVEETVVWQMRFPSGALAQLGASYDTHQARRYRVLMERGWAQMDPAFAYEGLRMMVAHRSAERPDVEVQEDRTMGAKNQFALEMDHMAECVLLDKTPYTPGEEGLQDHRLMEAIYQSARSGRPIQLQAVAQRDAYRGSAPADA